MLVEDDTLSISVGSIGEGKSPKSPRRVLRTPGKAEVIAATMIGIRVVRSNLCQEHHGSFLLSITPVVELPIAVELAMVVAEAVLLGTEVALAVELVEVTFPVSTLL